VYTVSIFNKKEFLFIYLGGQYFFFCLVAIVIWLAWKMGKESF